jgi:CBS domain-containing protein
MEAQTLRAPIKTLNPSKPISVETGARVSQVLEIMRENRFGCVLVVENDVLVGIITERDILTKVVSIDDRMDVGVEEIMTRMPEYLFADDQVAFALNRMHVGGFRHVPLIDLRGKPTGIVSVRDILAFIYDNVVEPN